MYRVALSVARLKRRQQGVHQAVRLGGMVAAKVADVHVHRDTHLLGPGVHAQVRLGQEHRSRHAAGAMFCSRKTVRELVDRLQTCCQNFLRAAAHQTRGIRQPSGIALAVVEVGGEVKTLHK